METVLPIVMVDSNTMKHVKDGKWACSQDGDCCRLFAEFTLGTKPCPSLKCDGGCSQYSTRPKVCRVSTINIPELNKEEYMIMRCHLIHKLQEWKNECGENDSTRWILEKIVKSGIL